MEVSIHLHVTVALPPGKEPPVHIVYEAGWTSGSVWTLWRTTNVALRYISSVHKQQDASSTSFLQASYLVAFYSYTLSQTRFYQDKRALPGNPSPAFSSLTLFTLLTVIILAFRLMSPKLSFYFSGCFMLVSRLSYSSNLKMEAK
jgi:hypothetical protein